MTQLRRSLLPLAAVAFLGASAISAFAADPLVIWYTHKGAESLYRSAKYSDAETMCKQAIEAIEKAHGKNSPELAAPLNDLATVYLRQARFADAKLVIDRADSVLDPRVPEQALLIGRLGINKGWRLYSLGETEAARKVFENARTLIEKNTKGDTVDLAEIINNIALMDEDIGGDTEDEAMLDRSRTMLLQAWQMRKKLTGDESPETAESLNNLGMHLLLTPKDPQDIDLAMKTLQKSLEVAIKVYGEQNPETAMSHANLAIALLAHDDIDGAEKELQKALPVTTKFLGKINPDHAYELTTLGRIAEEQTRYDDAEKDFTEAVSIDEAVYGKNNPAVATSLQYLQKLYEETGDTAKSNDIQRRIEKISGKGI